MIAFCVFQVDSYGGTLSYKVSYLLQRDGSEPVNKPDVVLRGNGNRLISRLGSPTSPDVKNQREVKFTEVSLYIYIYIYTCTVVTVARFYISHYKYNRLHQSSFRLSLS